MHSVGFTATVTNELAVYSTCPWQERAAPRAGQGRCRLQCLQLVLLSVVQPKRPCAHARGCVCSFRAQLCCARAPDAPFKQLAPTLPSMAGWIGRSTLTSVSRHYCNINRGCTHVRVHTFWQPLCPCATCPPRTALITPTQSLALRNSPCLSQPPPYLLQHVQPHITPHFLRLVREHIPSRTRANPCHLGPSYTPNQS